MSIQNNKYLNVFLKIYTECCSILKKVLWHIKRLYHTSIFIIYIYINCLIHFHVVFTYYFVLDVFFYALSLSTALWDITFPDTFLLVVIDSLRFISINTYQCKLTFYQLFEMFKAYIIFNLLKPVCLNVKSICLNLYVFT